MNLSNKQLEDYLIDLDPVAILIHTFYITILKWVVTGTLVVSSLMYTVPIVYRDVLETCGEYSKPAQGHDGSNS